MISFQTKKDTHPKLNWHIHSQYVNIISRNLLSDIPWL